MRHIFSCSLLPPSPHIIPRVHPTSPPFPHHGPLQGTHRARRPPRRSLISPVHRACCCSISTPTSSFRLQRCDLMSISIANVRLTLHRTTRRTTMSAPLTTIKPNLRTVVGTGPIPFPSTAYLPRYARVVFDLPLVKHPHIPSGYQRGRDLPADSRRAIPRRHSWPQPCVFCPHMDAKAGRPAHDGEYFEESH